MFGRQTVLFEMGNALLGSIGNALFAQPYCKFGGRSLADPILEGSAYMSVDSASEKTSRLRIEEAGGKLPMPVPARGKGKPCMGRPRISAAGRLFGVTRSNNAWSWPWFELQLVMLFK